MKTTVEFIMEFSGAVILLFAVSGLFAKLSGCQFYEDDMSESGEDKECTAQGNEGFFQHFSN